MALTRRAPGEETAAHSSRRDDWLRLDDAALLKECRQERYRASGPGGQRRNKVETAIRLHHRPSGLVAQAEESRLPEVNRTRALRRLRERMALVLRRLGIPAVARHPLWVSLCLVEAGIGVYLLAVPSTFAYGLALSALAAFTCINILAVRGARTEMCGCGLPFARNARQTLARNLLLSGIIIFAILLHDGGRDHYWSVGGRIAVGVILVPVLLLMSDPAQPQPEFG